MGPNCAHCGNEARLVDGSVVYPHRPDLFALNFWVCDECDARCGCHKPGAQTEIGVSDGTMPLGTPANAHLRALRSSVHRRLDPLWMGAAAKKLRHTARRRTYRVLARALGLTMEETHVGMFSATQCHEALRALQGMTTERVLAEGRYRDGDPEIRRNHEARP